MPKNYINKIEDCPHDGAHKEVCCGQRSGEWVCDACGEYWRSREALDYAREQYKKRKPFRGLSASAKEVAADAIEQLADDRVSDLVNSEDLSGLIAQTNATGWVLDTLEVDKESIDVDPDQINCSGTAQFAGDQDLDCPSCGEIISGMVRIRVDRDLQIAIEEGKFELEEM